MALDLNPKQASQSFRVGEISADNAAAPDDLDDALMAEAEQQGASGYRISSVSTMAPYVGTATLFAEPKMNKKIIQRPVQKMSQQLSDLLKASPEAPVTDCPTYSRHACELACFEKSDRQRIRW
ncbi:YdgH/BhsA/McbA-like domain containing protein [Klebsiella aerogenes]